MKLEDVSFSTVNQIGIGEPLAPIIDRPSLFVETSCRMARAHENLDFSSCNFGAIFSATFFFPAGKEQEEGKHEIKHTRSTENDSPCQNREVARASRVVTWA